MALVDAGGQAVDGCKDVFGTEVAEDEGTDFGACLAEGFCGIIIAVGSGEYRQTNHRTLNRLASSADAQTLRTGNAGTGFPLRDTDLPFARRGKPCGSVRDTRRIQLEVAPFVNILQGRQFHTYAIDADAAVRHGAKQLSGGEIKLSGHFHHGGTVSQREEVPLGNIHLHAQGVAHRHLHQRFGHATVAQRPGGNYLPGLDLAADESKGDVF